MNKEIAKVILLCCSSSVSLTASAILCVMIYRSGKLSTSYGRLMFGLSVSDVLLSIAFFIFYYAVLKDNSATGLGIGNMHTCTFAGSLFAFGGAAVNMYTCSLCIYYNCKLKMNMSDEMFYHKIEKWIHSTIFLLNVVVCTAGVLTKSVNALPGKDICTYQRGSGQYCEIFKYAYYPVGVPSVCIMGIIVSMISIFWNVLSSERSFLGVSTGKTLLMRLGNRIRALATRSDRAGEWEDLTLQQPNESDVQFNSRMYRKEIILQTLFYVSAYFITYGPAFYASVCTTLGLPTPSVLKFTIASLLPLGGFFNVLIYTRPAIVAFRKLCPGHSWHRAFYLVVKAGGTNPIRREDSEGSDSLLAHWGCCWKRSQNDDTPVTAVLREIYAPGSMAPDSLREKKYQETRMMVMSTLHDTEMDTKCTKAKSSLFSSTSLGDHPRGACNSSGSEDYVNLDLSTCNNIEDGKTRGAHKLDKSKSQRSQFETIDRKLSANELEDVKDGKVNYKADLEEEIGSVGTQRVKHVNISRKVDNDSSDMIQDAFKRAFSRANNHSAIPLREDKLPKSTNIAEDAFKRAFARASNIQIRREYDSDMNTIEGNAIEADDDGIIVKKKRALNPIEEAALKTQSAKVADAFNKAFERANKFEPKVLEPRKAKDQDDDKDQGNGMRLSNGIQLSTLVKYSELSTLAEGEGDGEEEE